MEFCLKWNCFNIHIKMIDEENFAKASLKTIFSSLKPMLMFFLPNSSINFKSCLLGTKISLFIGPLNLTVMSTFQ